MKIVKFFVCPVNVVALLLFFAFCMLQTTAHALEVEQSSNITFASDKAKASWLNEKLEIVDKDGKKVVMTMAEVLKLSQYVIKTGTPWLTGESRFSGPLLSDVLKQAKASDGTKIHAVASNEYEIEIPIADLKVYQPIIAITLNNKPMSLREKGPYWIMYNFDENPKLKTESFFSRCIWQLYKIVVQ